VNREEMTFDRTDNELHKAFGDFLVYCDEGGLKIVEDG